MTYRDGTGHVAVIALVHRADIKGEEVAVADDPLPRHAVRQGGVLAGDADQVERHALAAVHLYQVLKLHGDLSFGHAGLEEVEHLKIRALGDPLGGDDPLDLVRGFTDAGRVDETEGCAVYVEHFCGTSAG